MITTHLVSSHRPKSLRNPRKLIVVDEREGVCLLEISDTHVVDHIDKSIVLPLGQVNLDNLLEVVFVLGNLRFKDGLSFFERHVFEF